MDYSKFSDDGFALKSWVNAALMASEQNPNTLVMKLQLLMQEVNTSLEDTTTTLLADIPRIVTEIQALNSEAILLRNQMNLVKADINKVEKESVESMSTVVKLDKIKERMLTTERKLKQADNWTLLNEHIHQLFTEQDMEGISEKLCEMRVALSALVNLPDYEARSDRLSNLSNKLEAMISPRLILALNTHDTHEAQCYYRIFSAMGRTDQLYNYYYRANRTNVNKKFAGFRTADTLDTWLGPFYSYLLELYYEESRWGSYVFGTPTVVVLTLLTQCLSGVDLQHDINNYIADGQKPVMALSFLLDNVNRFSASISKEVTSHIGTDIVEQLGRAVISPYTKHVLSFGDKVKTTLLRDVNSLPIRMKRTSTDSLAELQRSTKSMITHVRDCIPTCLELTDGNAVTDVIAAMEFYFDLFCEKLNALVREFRTAFGIEQGAQPTLQEEHWVGFQSCFKFLQILGECYTDLEHLQAEMIDIVRDHAPNEIPLLKNINIWRENNLSKYATNSKLIESLKDGSTTTLFSKTFKLFLKPVNACNKLCVDFVLASVKKNVHGIHLSQEWYKEEGAVFTPSPLSYITALGDYLLLLPQQLEPFFTEENIPLDTALRLVLFTELPGMTEDMEGDAFAWLTCVCQSTMLTIVEMILRIPKLTSAGCKQLSGDISYICNVMAALEVPLSRDVIHISRLLTLPINMCVSEETKDIPRYLCEKIAGMRRAAV